MILIPRNSEIRNSNITRLSKPALLAIVVDYMMATTVAEDKIDGRKCANTKIQYRRKFLHFEKWIRERYPMCIKEVTSTVNSLSVEKSHLMEFFGICRKRDRNGIFIDPTVSQTFQHVSAYKSAIKDF